MLKFVCFCSVLALAAAKPSVVAPLAYSAVPVVSYSSVPAVSSVSQYSNSVVHGSQVVPAVYGATYSPVVPALYPSVALSQAPNSPAVVLDGVNGVPLDTPEVVAARVAHYQAKALSGVHHLAKRSVTPVTYSSVFNPVSPLVYHTPYVSAFNAPLESTYAYSAVVPKTYTVHSW